MKKINYTQLDKIFHKIILGNKFVGEFLFDLENFIYKNKYQNLKNEKHIFISGYARSGTTLLLQLLYETKKYSTLRYADVPFILAPVIGGLLLHIAVVIVQPRSLKALPTKDVSNFCPFPVFCAFI